MSEQPDKAYLAAKAHLKKLLELFPPEPGENVEWHDDVVRAFLAGWSASDEQFKGLVEAAREWGKADAEERRLANGDRTGSDWCRDFNNAGNRCVEAESALRAELAKLDG